LSLYEAVSLPCPYSLSPVSDQPEPECDSQIRDQENVGVAQPGDPID